MRPDARQGFSIVRAKAVCRRSALSESPAGTLVRGEGAVLQQADAFPAPDHQPIANKPTSKTQLPALLAELEGVVGRDAALKFANACGGTRVYIPAHLRAEHWLIEAIGFAAAQKLSTHFTFGRRGIHLNVPMMPRSLQVQTLDNAGASSREIALKLGIHQRTVHRIRSKHRHGRT